MSIGFSYPHQPSPTAEVTAAIATTVEVIRLHAMLTNEPITEETVSKAIDLLFEQVKTQAVTAAKQQLGL